MKSKKKLYSITLASIAFVFFFLISVSSTALAASTQRVDGQLILTETQITVNGSYQGSPAIYGDRIVWADDRNGPGNYDIYMYDLSTSKEIQITTNESSQFEPDIYEDKIVWTDYRNENDDIYMYNLSTSTEIQITANSEGQYDAAIYGDKIVWTDDRNLGFYQNYDIYMYNLSTCVETQITTNESIQCYPEIYGDRIIWIDRRNEHYDVYTYNLSTSEETQIVSYESEYSHDSPVIYGDMIVGIDFRNGNWDGDIYACIYAYNLTTLKETPIFINESDPHNCDIYNDRIVWADRRYYNGYGYNQDIYIYNLSTSKETRITTNSPHSQSPASPAIYGNRIVWDDARNGNYDIYMCTVLGTETAPKTPVVNWSANVNEGYAPLSVQFIDLSENATSRIWDFNYDGIADSTEKTPVYVYSAPGTYTVNLTVSNANGSASKLNTINVLQPSVYAYITNCESNTVSIIDIATNTVTATVPVGSRPCGVAVTPDGKKVYVGNEISGTVSVIDTATNTVTATVDVGDFPEGVAVSPDGTKVYVTNYDSWSVSVIDTETDTVAATVDVHSPYGVAVSPDGKKVYVTNNVYDYVYVIDTATNTVTSTVPVGGPSMSTGVAVTPDGTKVYVTNYIDCTVSVIDTATNNVIDTVNVGSSPTGVAVTPDGSKVYVGNYYSNTVSVIDTTTNTVTATVSGLNGPLGVSVTPDGTKVYVTNSGYQSNSVSVIDTATNTVTTTVNVGIGPVAFGQFIGSVPVKPVLPVANFSSNVTKGYATLPVQFTDISENATGWKWDFGDGSTSIEQNPEHAFIGEGIYNVTLVATNDDGSSDIKSMNITVNRVPTPPVANFSADPTEGYAPLSVQFTDLSENETSVNWDFNNDGISDSEERNPVYEFTTQGIYTVNLKATNENGNTSTIGHINVTAAPAKIMPKANFTTSQTAPFTVQFNDLSLNATGRTWNFGDGATSTDANPSHIYATSGKFTANLTVSNTNGTDAVNKTIAVTGKLIRGPPKAIFTAKPLAGGAPLTVKFTDKSINAASIKWNFGDKSEISTESKSSHTYQTAGIYLVKLTATNGNKSNVAAKIVIVAGRWRR